MKRKRFSADDWITLGLNALASGGTEAVKLEAICAAAGRTRGSFYYHFQDHSAFLLALAHAWTKRQTDDAVDTLASDKSAEDNAKVLTAAAMSLDYALELGIRELARRFPEIEATVKATDQRRLDILSHLYAQRFQLDADDARDLAFLEYAAFSGMILLAPDLAPEAQHDLAARYDGLMQRALGGD